MQEKVRRQILRNQIQNHLRKREVESLDKIWDEAGLECGKVIGRNTSLTPSSAAAEYERRQRGKLILSDVLREFCREHEKDSKGRRIKKIFERQLRYQSNAEIMRAMDLPKDKFYKIHWDALSWVANRIQQADVHGSVFLSWSNR